MRRHEKEIKKLLEEDEREVTAFREASFKPHPWFDFPPNKTIKREPPK